MPRHTHSRTLSKLNPPMQNLMPPSADNSSPIIGRSRKNTAGPPRTQRGGSFHGSSAMPPTHHHFTPAPVVINPELLVTRQWPLFSFSATGSCSSLIPSSDGYGHHSNNIKVTEINNVLDQQDSLVKSFPGPLQKNKTKSKDIEKWIDERLRSIGSDGEVFVTGEQLLWGVLKVMIDNIHKKDDFMKNEEYIKQVVKVLNPSLVIKDIGSSVDVVTLARIMHEPPVRTQSTSSSLTGSELVRVHNLLLEGDKQTALHLALSHRDWAMSLLIANIIGGACFDEIMKLFVATSFDPNDPIQKNLGFFLQFNSNGVDLNVQFKGKEQWLVNNYKTIVPFILLNNSKAGDVLLKLGGLLLNAGYKDYAKLSYILSGLPLIPEKPQLLPTDIYSLIMDQIYEFILLSSNNVPHALSHGFPHILACKLIHAGYLTDMGIADDAKKYSDHIITVLKSKQVFFEPVVGLAMDHLSERLSRTPTSANGQGWFGGKLGRPNLDKVWGTLDKSFNKFVAGEDIVDNRSKSATDGVFSKYNSPSVSRVSSHMNLSQAAANTTSIRGPYGNAMNATSASSLLKQKPSTTNLYSGMGVSQDNDSSALNIGHHGYPPSSRKVPHHPGLSKVSSSIGISGSNPYGPAPTERRSSKGYLPLAKGGNPYAPPAIDHASVASAQASPQVQAGSQSPPTQYHHPKLSASSVYSPGGRSGNSTPGTKSPYLPHQSLNKSSPVNHPSNAHNYPQTPEKRSSLSGASSSAAYLPHPQTVSKPHPANPYSSVNSTPREERFSHHSRESSIDSHPSYDRTYSKAPSVMSPPLRSPLGHPAAAHHLSHPEPSTKEATSPSPTIEHSYPVTKPPLNERASNSYAPVLPAASDPTTQSITAVVESDIEEPYSQSAPSNVTTPVSAPLPPSSNSAPIPPAASNPPPAAVRAAPPARAEVKSPLAAAPSPYAPRKPRAKAKRPRAANPYAPIVSSSTTASSSSSGPTPDSKAEEKVSEAPVADVRPAAANPYAPSAPVAAPATSEEKEQEKPVENVPHHDHSPSVSSNHTHQPSVSSTHNKQSSVSSNHERTPSTSSNPPVNHEEAKTPAPPKSPVAHKPAGRRTPSNPYAPIGAGNRNKRKPVNPYAPRAASGANLHKTSSYAPANADAAAPAAAPDMSNMGQFDYFSMSGYSVPAPTAPAPADLDVESDKAKQDEANKKEHELQADEKDELRDEFPTEPFDSRRLTATPSYSHQAAHLSNMFNPPTPDIVDGADAGDSNRSHHARGSFSGARGSFSGARGSFSGALESMSPRASIAGLHSPIFHTSRPGSVVSSNTLHKRPSIFITEDKKRFYADDTDEYYDDVPEDDDVISINEKKKRDAAAEAKKKKEEKEAKKKKEEEEKKRKKEEAAKARADAAAQKHKSGGSWLGWLSKKQDDGSPKPIKAKLGEESSFHYDEKLKRWVNSNASEEEQAASAPPPPPMKKKPTTSMTTPSSPLMSGSAAPPTPGGAAGPPRAGGPSGPPSRAPSAPPTMKSASNIDDLLSMAARGGPSTGSVGRRSKRGPRRGYVDVMKK
ncbi:unnamed protein product [Ambrosiozyma monospora]|uniref:Protein transport protein sec16 n=1 Tax=Ambrosiozyma monospora TaxID=43982 RepID=A0A9W7DF52_AMBMO|nr:unnamed protein product [Ambrosiozyma monospora]